MISVMIYGGIVGCHLSFENPKELRQKFGSMSAAELAKTLGIARSTVMRIEGGQTMPSDDLLNRLKVIQVIGISIFQRLSETDKNRFPKVIEEMGENPELFAVSGMLRELTPAGYSPVWGPSRGRL